MCTFDPKLTAATMAPNLSKEERKQYLVGETEFIEELLEDTDDCKWVYQALVDLAFLEANLNSGMSNEVKEKTRDHIHKLTTLDPLRKGRWIDLEKALDSQ